MMLHINTLTEVGLPAAGSDSSVLWVPSEYVALHRIALPTAPRRKWSQLIPWMLEEALLEPIPALHFVNAGTLPAGDLLILVTARAQMQAWQAQVMAAGLRDYSLFPDYLALPWQAGEVTLTRRDDQILVRHDRLQGYAAEPVLAWMLLERILSAEPENLQKLRLAGLSRADLPETLRAMPVVEAAAPDWQQAGMPAPELNLLQGDFALSSPLRMDSKWLSTAALLLLALASTYAYLWSDNRRLQEDLERLSTANREAVPLMFPGLNVRGGDVRNTVEEYIALRFRQRESLDAASMRLLTDLDRFLRDCACRIEALQLDGGTAGLLLRPEAEARLQQVSMPGYRREFSRQDDQYVHLALSPEPGP